MEFIEQVMSNPTSRKRIRDVAYDELWRNGNTSVVWLGPEGLPRDVWGLIVGFLQHDINLDVTNLLLVSKSFSNIILRFLKFDEDLIDTYTLLEKLVFNEDEYAPWLWETYGFDNLKNCVEELSYNTDIVSQLPDFIRDQEDRNFSYDHNVLELIHYLKTGFARVAVALMASENPFRDGRRLFWLFRKCGFAPVDRKVIPRIDVYDDPTKLHDKYLNLKLIDNPTFYNLTNMYNAYRYMAKHFYDLELPDLVPGDSMTPITMFNAVDVE